MRILFLIAFLLFISVPVQAQTTATGASVFAASGLPIPRFVSLRSDKVFVRTGPALRYPIKWIFKKEGLPVEIIQEFDTWRKVRDSDGEEGWIHQSLLSGNRSVLIQSQDAVALSRDPEHTGEKVALLEPGVVAVLSRCQGTLCEVSAGGYKGWAPRNLLWGIYENEELQ